jgi:hypothetical protein
MSVCSYQRRPFNGQSVQLTMISLLLQAFLGILNMIHLRSEPKDSFSIAVNLKKRHSAKWLTNLFKALVSS